MLPSDKRGRIAFVLLLLAVVSLVGSWCVPFNSINPDPEDHLYVLSWCGEYVRNMVILPNFVNALGKALLVDFAIFLGAGFLLTTSPWLVSYYRRARPLLVIAFALTGYLFFHQVQELRSVGSNVNDPSGRYFIFYFSALILHALGLYLLFRREEGREDNYGVHRS